MRLWVQRHVLTDGTGGYAAEPQIVQTSSRASSARKMPVGPLPLWQLYTAENLQGASSREPATVKLLKAATTLKYVRVMVQMGRRCNPEQSRQNSAPGAGSRW